MKYDDGDNQLAENPPDTHNFTLVGQIKRTIKLPKVETNLHNVHNSLQYSRIFFIITINFPADNTRELTNDYVNEFYEEMFLCRSGTQ